MNKIIFIVILFTTACSVQNIVTNQEYKLKEIINSDNDTILKNIISPYKTQIDQDLNDTLTYISKTMFKGQSDGELGNYLTDICMSKYNNIADFCILNNGGIRSTLDSGYITKKDIYRLMPFDNKLVVVEINHSNFTELIRFLKNKKEPIAGLKINNNIKIYNYKKKEWLIVNLNNNHNDKVFNVLTSDYLANGGGGMTFLHNKETINTNEMLRDLIISSIQQNDTLKYINNKRYGKDK